MEELVNLAMKSLRGSSSFLDVDEIDIVFSPLLTAEGSVLFDLSDVMNKFGDGIAEIFRDSIDDESYEVFHRDWVSGRLCFRQIVQILLAIHCDFSSLLAALNEALLDQVWFMAFENDFCFKIQLGSQGSKAPSTLFEYF